MGLLIMIIGAATMCIGLWTIMPAAAIVAVGVWLIIFGMLLMAGS